MKDWLRRVFPELLNEWGRLTGYQRFERAVSLVLTGAIAGVVVVAIFYLLQNVVVLLFIQTQDPFDFRVFQAVFDMILTVLIAMEFNNSIVRTMEGRGSFIQVEIVVLIAIMALVRKFMVMDTEDLDPMKILALAAAVLALGVTYWLVRRGGASRDGSRDTGSV